MVKKFEIWNSRIHMDDWKDFIEEERLECPGKYDDDNEMYDHIIDINGYYLEDERMNLNIQLSNPIIVIANLGLWNGRHTAYKIINSGNIKDILYSEMEDAHWYCDGYNICCDAYHHDGVNHYIYREIQNPENIQKFLDMIYYGKDFKSVLNYYTRSIASDVVKAYGFAKEVA